LASFSGGKDNSLSGVSNLNINLSIINSML